ncbi:hypothetical protein GALMADRAFT_211671 [Galerina marginata CBS 339.88]|uniref:Uncharacterized protein n=1 Tax=Galerina marginata (strain CBS 339.88) TaxID=685588 RepID=A0A067SUV3_GALM3|nr:hypothetical protein GALMADRAFT_211671 [Galerina marginata CBS 339.88]
MGDMRWKGFSACNININILRQKYSKGDWEVCAQGLQPVTEKDSYNNKWDRVLILSDHAVVNRQQQEFRWHDPVVVVAWLFLDNCFVSGFRRPPSSPALYNSILIMPAKRKPDRLAFPGLITGERSPKNPRLEGVTFQRALEDATGYPSPDLQTLGESTLPILKSVCVAFELPVAKSGGTGARPASIKKDYLNAIVQRLLIDKSSEILGNEHSDLTAFLLSSGSSSAMRDGDKMQVDRPQPLRLFKKPADYETSFESEIQLSYLPELGISLQDLTKELSLDASEVETPVDTKWQGGLVSASNATWDP